MAGAEVTMSSRQAMAMKEEEGECSDNNDMTQVILHLNGINYVTADSGTTVLAIETPQNSSETKGEDIEYGYPITCGSSRAVLLFKKFVCPGINVRCVKFNDQLISPKQFVHLAGKDTLKDWKRAIRLGGVMLRKMMDSGQIDFYQHDSVCSNTCRSTKFDVLINSTRPPPGTLVQPSLSCLALDPVGGQVPPLTGDVHKSAELEPSLEDKLSAIAERSDGPPQLVNPTTANGYCSKRNSADKADGVLGLWRAVTDSGLMGEVLHSLQTELLTTLKRVELCSEKAILQETDALILNSLCEMFGLLDSVKQAVDKRHGQNEESKTQNSVYVVDDILKGQRRQSYNKKRSHRRSTFKQIQPHHHSQLNRCNQNRPSSVKISTVIQPLSVTGSSAPLHARPFAQLPTITGHHHRASSTDTDGHSGQQKVGKMQQKIGEAGNLERLPQMGHEDGEEEDMAGMHKGIGQGGARPLQDSHMRSEELDGEKGTHVAEHYN